MFFHSRGDIKMYLWIFRLILFFPNPFPDTAPCNFLEAGKGGQEFVKFPCFAVSWLSLCWLRSSVSLPFTYFPDFVGFSLWGLRCFYRPKPWILLYKGDGEKGSSWDWAEPSAAVCAMGSRWLLCFVRKVSVWQRATSVNLSTGELLPSSSPSLPSQAWHQPNLKTSG